jgi:hypothetical protein
VVEELSQKTGKSKTLYGFTVSAGGKQMEISDPDKAYVS